MISILLPIYFTYKALRTNSSPLLIPWLQYWSTLALFLLFESYLPILPWLPLYGIIRLVFLTYLVLPQTQGARFLYTAYIEPFLVENENRIDRLITDAHEKVRANGLDYIYQAVEWVKRNILHLQSGTSPQEQRPAPRSAESYVSGLLARFSSPRPGAPSGASTTSPAGDIYTLLSTAASTLGLNPSTASSPAARDAQIDSLAHSGALIPPNLKTLAERVDFVSAQREKLRVLLGALDKEAGELEIQKDVEKRVGKGPGGLVSRKSEGEFERVEKDEAESEQGSKVASGVGAGMGSPTSGWFGWMGGAKSPGEGMKDDKAEGRSSGVET